MVASRYWRVINIKSSDYASAGGHEICELKFINKEGILCNDPSKGISLNSYSSSYVPGNAFDNNLSSVAGSTKSADGSFWWIGYKFDVPVTVTEITIINSTSAGRQWLNALVESSDDGINWQPRGSCSFTQQSSNIQAPISSLIINFDNLISEKYFDTGLVNFSKISMKGYIIMKNIKPINFLKPASANNIEISENIYISDLRLKNIHTIKDYVYKENVGVRTHLFLYERESGELIYKTESDDTGYFEFNNLDKNLEYVVTSNDKKHQFKSIIKNYDR